MYRWVAILTLFGGVFAGCQRAPRQVVEDGKTAGHHVGRAFESLGGKGGRSRKGPSQEAFGEADGAFDPSGVRNVGDAEPGFETGDEGDIPERYRQSGPSPGEENSPLPGIEAFGAPNGELAGILVPIYFETDQDRPRDQRDRDHLVKIAEYLRRHPKTYLYIEGHCDERGTAAYNLSLGSRRSNSIRKRLIDLGIGPEQLFTISYGKERPRVTGYQEVTWRQNRRVEFRVLEWNKTA